ncbi:MAG: SH3 domain-containing protein [Prochlorothrix sp.]|nr:SH3 domain-containing protein [Prochlorothrix sp.]
MNLSNLLRFLLGVSLGLALLLTGSIAAARYLLEQFTTPPAKPIFAEELPSPSPSPVPVVVASPTPSPGPNPSPSPTASPTPNPTASPSASPSPSPSPSPTASPTPPPGDTGTVSWPDGLVIRESPSVGAGTVGGVDYNQRVVILETSADGDWQRIWFNGTEGWIKAGNLN